MTNPSTQVATAVFDALVAGGVEHVVLCPGSRSAPLAFAAFAADVHLHTRIDERSAAFLALGLAKGSRRPAAIVVTSGTAAANLHPAVLEARHAGVQLILLTADRPVALRGTNANQTTDQVDLFGRAAPCTDVAAGDVDGARLAVAAAVTAPGPSQVNLQFAEPLLPAPSGLVRGQAPQTPAAPLPVVRDVPAASPGLPRGAFDQGRGSTPEPLLPAPGGLVRGQAPQTPAAPLPVVRDVPAASPGLSRAAFDQGRGSTPEPLLPAPGGLVRGQGPETPAAPREPGPARDVRSASPGWSRAAFDQRRGSTPRPVLPPLTVVVAGDDAGPEARRIAQANGWPVLAEPSSGSRTGPNAIRTYRLLLDGPVWDRIQAVVVCGHPTLSRPITRLISRGDLPVYGLPGPLGLTDPGHVARPLDGEPRTETVDPDWLRRWQERDREVAAAVDAHLAGTPGLTPHEVAAEVAAAVPGGGLLFVGASNPVRDLDLMMAPYPVGERRMVMANRGLAGIDGTVSAAIGVALGRPWSTRALALVGDVTFLHDSNGLQIGPGEDRPDLTIVVVNDDGGSIFAVLEQGAPAYQAAFDKLFGTPHSVDLAALCRAHGVPHRRIHDRHELTAALARPANGVEVVEAVVGRGDRRALDAALRGLAQQEGR